MRAMFSFIFTCYRALLIIDISITTHIINYKDKPDFEKNISWDYTAVFKSEGTPTENPPYCQLVQPYLESAEAGYDLRLIDNFQKSNDWRCKVSE